MPLACPHVGSAYPFEPKSNAYLHPGQFWEDPLSDGRWACGRVLAFKSESDSYFHGNNRTFLAALMDWEGDEPPTAEGIAGHRAVAQGWAHVLTIQKNGGQILGDHARYWPPQQAGNGSA